MFLNNKKAAFILVAVFFVLIDRFFKMLALHIKYHEPINLVGDFFRFSFAPNYYIAFSLPLSGVFLNILIGIIILSLSFYLFSLSKKGELYEFSFLIFVWFGAVSNYFDRLKYGFVIDYLDLKYFTVFNVADCMIVVSVFFFITLTYIKNGRS